jgi:hypothetical protein
LANTRVFEQTSVIQQTRLSGAFQSLSLSSWLPIFFEETDMKTFHAGLLLVCGMATSTLYAQEKKIERTQLPPAVEKTVAVVSTGATIRGFSMEKENGQTCYEAKLLADGRTRDVLIATSGAVVEVEQEIAMDSLPAAVRQGLTARAGSGKLGKVESITRHDKLVAYEAKVITGGKKSEVQVGPDGKPLDHEE